MVVIVGGTDYQLQVDVMLNEWFGQFYDMVQKALTMPNALTQADFFGVLLSFFKIAGIYVVITTLLNFFSKHWVFRWRTEMNDYYTTNWKELHHIEGASQRVQEDTKRFAAIMEGLGVAFLDSVMTLFALFGTAVLTAVGYKMPWLEFNNQVVNAVYRKQLVYGEDDTDRITPPTVAEFFGNVRKNYYRLFFHYLYFDVAKISYLQAGVLVPCVALAPTIVAGAITLGVMQQIVRAFGRVESSLQFPVHSRSKIVKLISIYKRLQSFEAVLEGKDVPHWGSQKID